MLQNLFLSTYTNSIDKKGRISVPANFRNMINKESQHLIACPSIKNSCVEVYDDVRLETISNAVKALPPYSAERDAFETVIMGEATMLSIDGEGRVILPKHFLQYAKINTKATFIGKGTTFEIWNPDELNAYMSKAKQIAKKNLSILKNT
ncbi:cell division/cell wall cluster transcriptional repressor MraZ [Candidatus Sneabacter namystus]|uniref:Transcriptional regulator MraZ n=2 Tax=Candidatus Sneabacter namystus TaxID=2601646 RepID=A0A5C0UIJ1_9RICK|nr:cell division/cell wall cluster transcriptional repressor MraZ [Candidatus Sneabacter namystus]